MLVKIVKRFMVWHYSHTCFILHTHTLTHYTPSLITHCHSHRYGLSQFVLLSPGEGESALTSQAQANLMISSVSVAISNTSCVTPVFVQVHQKWRQVYVGVAEGGDLRVNYNMVHLKYTPPNYRHLSGLLDLFKGKLVCTVHNYCCHVHFEALSLNGHNLS